MSEKFSGGRAVRELVAAVAGPREWSDTRESWINRAARRAGISFRQAKALFYGEITDPFHKSARLMRDAAERLEAAAHRMEATDPDFYRPHIEAHRMAARDLLRLGGGDVGAAVRGDDPDSPGTDPEGRLNPGETG